MRNVVRAVRRSALVERARVGGAAADRAADERAPSRGHGPPGARAGMWSPVCEPPRRPSTRRVVRIARCRRLASRRRRGVSAGRAGIDAGAPQRLVGEQVAEPGDAGLVHQHRLHRRAAAGEHRARAAASVSANASGPSRSSSGSSSTAPSRRGSRRYERPAVGEPHPEAVPRRRRHGCSRRASGSPAASPSIEHPAAHAEVEAEHRAVAVGVEEQELARAGARVVSSTAAERAASRRAA